MNDDKEDAVRSALGQLRFEEEEYEELLRTGSPEEIAEYGETCTQIYETNDWRAVRLRQIRVFEDRLARPKTVGCSVLILAAGFGISGALWFAAVSS